MVGVTTRKTGKMEVATFWVAEWLAVAALTLPPSQQTPPKPTKLGRSKSMAIARGECLRVRCVCFVDRIKFEVEAPSVSIAAADPQPFGAIRRGDDGWIVC